MNVTNTNWSAIVNTALQNSAVEGAGQIKATAAQGTDGNLSVTLTGTDGKNYTFTADAPELDAATGEPTPESLQSLATKLDEQIELFQTQVAEVGELVQSSGATASSTGSKKVLFDIYALMNLMLEIAQKQRENARTEREADLSRATTDIKNQAEIQRSAAFLGMMMSIGMSVVSIGLQAGSLIGSIKAQGTAMKMEKNAGLSNLRNDLDILTASNGEETQQNLNTVRGQMSGAQYEAASQKFADTLAAKGELDNAVQQKNQAVIARDDYANACKSLKDTLGPVDEQISAKETEIASLKSELDIMQEDQEHAINPGYEQDGSQLKEDIEAKQLELQTARDELSQLKAQRSKIVARGGDGDTKLAELNKRVTDTETALKTAQDNFAAKASADMTNLDGKIAIARTTGNTEELAALEQQRTWGRAYVTDAKMDAGMKTSIAEDIRGCETVIGQKSEALHLDADYKKANMRSMAFDQAGRMAQQLGDLLNTVAQKTADMKSAEATDKEAEAKVHENMQQESDDLAESAQRLLQSVVQLLQQVLEAENQSIRQIVA